MEQMWLEIAKQLPAVAAILIVVGYAAKFILAVNKDHKEQMAAAEKETEARMERMMQAQTTALAETTKVVSTNTEMMGSIRTLFLLVEEDLKRGHREDRAAAAKQ
jgi:hypothetical protein